MGIWAGAECLGGGYYGAGGGAGKGSYRLGWALREQRSYDVAIVVDPWKPQGSMGGDLLWEDLPSTCGLVFLCALLNVCTSGPTACTLL